MRRVLSLCLLLLLGVVPIADASKTRLRLERIDASDFSSDGVVRFYASIVELEGNVLDDRPLPAWNLKVNGKSQGKPEKMARFQLAGDPLDLILVIESSSLYGPKQAVAAPGAVAPPPPTRAPKGAKGVKPAKGAKGAKGKPAGGRSVLKASAGPVSHDDPIERVKEAVGQLLEQLSPKWRVLVIDYGGELNTHPPFRPAGAVGSDVEGLEPDGDAGDLKLIAAIDAARVELNKQRLKTKNDENAKPARQLIVVISDGLNYNMDRKAFRTVGAESAALLIPIHTIAFSPTDDRGPMLNLGEISKLSNGTFRWARNADDLKNQVETLADELNKQYVLTWKIDESSLENLTFQLTCSELTSNALKYGKGFENLFKGGKRGLGWWWLAIIGGLLGIAFLVLFIMAQRHVEVADFSQKKQAAGPAAPGQAAAPAVAARPAVIQRGRITVVGGSLSGTQAQVALGGQPVLIGKGPATIQITDDPAVSTRHAMIYVDGNGVICADQNSTNGTFVNGHRITAPVLLGDGDLLRFGSTNMKFRAE